MHLLTVLMYSSDLPVLNQVPGREKDFVFNKLPNSLFGGTGIAEASLQPEMPKLQLTLCDRLFWTEDGDANLIGFIVINLVIRYVNIEEETNYLNFSFSLFFSFFIVLSSQ